MIDEYDNARLVRGGNWDDEPEDDNNKFQQDKYSQRDLVERPEDYKNEYKVVTSEEKNEQVIHPEDPVLIDDKRDYVNGIVAPPPREEKEETKERKAVPVLKKNSKFLPKSDHAFAGLNCDWIHWSRPGERAPIEKKAYDTNRAKIKVGGRIFSFSSLILFLSLFIIDLCLEF